MQVAKWIVPMLALLIGFNAQAVEPAAGARGTVKGVVMQADGVTPAADVMVGLKAIAPSRDKKNDKKDRKKADGLVEKSAPSAAGVLTTTTDANGSFTLEVPAGQYIIAAQAKKLGRARDTITVSENQTTTLTLTLQGPPKQEGDPDKPRRKKDPK